MRPSGSKVELYAAIRRDARAGKSARAIQREYRVSWTTVQRALGSAWPSERKEYANRATPARGLMLSAVRKTHSGPGRWVEVLRRTGSD